MLGEEKAHSSLVVSRNGKLELRCACKKQLASVFGGELVLFGPQSQTFH